MQILLCDSMAHAALCDGLACEYFRDVDGNKGAQWSGIYAKPGDPSDAYGIIWEPQLGAVFGPASGLPIEDDVAGVWVPLPEPEPEINDDP